jgi:hypothetical protein
MEQLVLTEPQVQQDQRARQVLPVRMEQQVPMARLVPRVLMVLTELMERPDQQAPQV